MTTLAKRMVAGSALTGSVAIYYTAPAATRTVIKAASIHNSTGAPISAVVNLVPNGGSAAVSNQVINRSIAGAETYSCPELINHVIDPGGTLQAVGNGLTLVVSGVEIS